MDKTKCELKRNEPNSTHSIVVPVVSFNIHIPDDVENKKKFVEDFLDKQNIRNSVDNSIYTDEPIRVYETEYDEEGVEFGFKNLTWWDNRL